MQENSNLFNIDKSEQTDINHNHFFFNKNTEIIKQNQPRKVVFGTFEQQKKTLYQTLSPYLYSLATTTGHIAGEAGKGAFSLLKNGFWWVYEKITNDVIPYTIEQLPKLLFVIDKNKKKLQAQQSGSFQVLQLDGEEYQKISKNTSDKKRLIIPLGNQNDQNFIKFLEKQNFVQQNSFPIDIDDEESMMQQNIMIPSDTFEILYDQAVCKQIQRNLPIQQKKIIHKLPNCFIFDLQGKNSIQYDMLDGIQKNQKCQSGLFVLPETLAKKNSSRTDPSGECPLQTIQQQKKQIKKQKVEELKKQEIKKKVVDNTRNVKVQIQPPIYSVQVQKETKKRQVMYS